jgi:hypothetical protein
VEVSREMGTVDRSMFVSIQFFIYIIIIILLIIRVMKFKF